MFRRPATNFIRRLPHKQQKNILRRNYSEYSTEIQNALKPKPTSPKWKTYTKWGILFLIAASISQPLYWKLKYGYTAEDLLEHRAEQVRLVHFIQESKKKGEKKSDFELINDFYRKHLRKIDLDGPLPEFAAKNKSLLKKYLTADVWEELKHQKTSRGNGLDKIISSGLSNHDASIGVYAPDADAYKVFAPLFNQVISDYHGGYNATSDHHPQDFDLNHLNGDDIDPEGRYVVSTRIRVGRNLDGYPLVPGLSRKERQEIERKIVSALQSLRGDLDGQYYALGTMSEADRNQLIQDHFLFKRGDRHLEAAGANRDWPEGRGIYHSKDKRFLVWVNEEDQLRIISMQMGANVREVFERLSRAVKNLDSRLNFAFDDHLGYLSSCPTNLGTAMRASVHVKIPLVSQQPEFKEWCAKHNLSVRGIHGEHSESEGGIYDISNKRRLGVSEVQCVQNMMDGVRELISWEKRLEKQSPNEQA